MNECTSGYVIGCGRNRILRRREASPIESRFGRATSLFPCDCLGLRAQLKSNHRFHDTSLPSLCYPLKSSRPSYHPTQPNPPISPSSSPPTPLIPLLPPSHRLQRPLNAQNLSFGTLIKANLFLLLQVKHIVSLMHSIFQVAYIALGMQFLPWPRAHAAFAALEREEEGVEAGGEGEDGVGGYGGGCGGVGCG